MDFRELPSGFAGRSFRWEGGEGRVLLPSGLIPLITSTYLPSCTLCSFLCENRVSGGKNGSLGSVSSCTKLVTPSRAFWEFWLIGHHALLLLFGLLSEMWGGGCLVWGTEPLTCGIWCHLQVDSTKPNQARCYSNWQVLSVLFEFRKIHLPVSLTMFHLSP